jgi:hypothetical protein
MNSQQPDLEDAIVSTNAEPLAAVNVGILDKDGFIQQVITLEELVLVGDNQTLNLHNYATLGDVQYEFTISDAEYLCAKVAYLRERQARKAIIYRQTLEKDCHTFNTFNSIQ